MEVRPADDDTFEDRAGLCHAADATNAKGMLRQHGSIGKL
jgi:hypothetical protein